MLTEEPIRTATTTCGHHGDHEIEHRAYCNACQVGTTWFVSKVIVDRWVVLHAQSLAHLANTMPVDPATATVCESCE